MDQSLKNYFKSTNTIYLFGLMGDWLVYQIVRIVKTMKF